MSISVLTGASNFRPASPVGNSCSADSSNPQAAGAAGSGREGTEALKQRNAVAELLTPEQLRELSRLKARDREVRAHEQAHAAAGGAQAGAPSYTYQRGPDGQYYAVGGEVSIDTSTIAGDPAATIAKLRRVQAAATAPADPSPQDLKVATQAAQSIQQAAQELAAQESAERNGDGARENPAIRAYHGVAGDDDTPGVLVDLVA